MISYCTQCRWLLRASWVAQELLTTFAKELSEHDGELTLRPGTGGIFQVYIGDELIWDRARDGGFPDVAELKRLIRDRIAPKRDLGHIDRAALAE
ncbi:selenoprotein W-related protein [Microlunatus soli]|uniref:Selenoprotein W-related protein n=1 Tax=Microlunatus soli TaxID=630515 RepID=A0A1H1PHH3_9ACTN|nr:selenoprotein W-related protein [Microlunatus soli]